jgi:hypothetical protein
MIRRRAITNKLETRLVVAAFPPTRKPVPSSVTIEPGVAAQIEQTVLHLYRLGPRPIFETLCAIYGGADLIETLQDYRRLDPAVVAFLGADRLPPRRRRRRSRCRRWWS